MFWDQSLIFFVYSFLGWCCEVIYAASSTGGFVNRGYLNGPLCPIYGCGILFVSSLLTQIGDNLFLLFIVSTVITSAVELIVGFLSEKILHIRLWDYSNVPFNLGGYICLKFSLVWGLACVFIFKIIHPGLVALLGKIPHFITIPCICVFYIVFAVDFIVTTMQALKLSKRMDSILNLEKALSHLSFEVGENLLDRVSIMKERNESVKERLKSASPEISQRLEKYYSLFQDKNFIHSRLLRAFPNMKSAKYQKVLDKLYSLKKRK